MCANRKMIPEVENARCFSANNLESRDRVTARGREARRRNKELRFAASARQDRSGRGRRRNFGLARAEWGGEDDCGEAPAWIARSRRRRRAGVWQRSARATWPRALRHYAPGRARAGDAARARA